MGTVGKPEAEWWDLLPQGVREQVDGYVLQDSVLQAIRTVREAGRAHGLGLDDAQRVVDERFRHHGDRIARTPADPLDLESLTAEAAGYGGRIMAIEALWDGDTVHGWFVELRAVTADPAGDHLLAVIHRSTAVRLLGEGHAQPSAAAAERFGRPLAAHLSVPFHFASPDAPDDEAPRWSAAGRNSASAAGGNGAHQN
ncbi:hypothetical protein [Streptomyces sp. NBC_00102]|uniref:hypothetical protein n=1 Tax=Streptomyces sp. NBC_00102 TaxID=2975652 RepID=UPI0022583FBF|nr:hypothetical protein [Streptomyces sp. NBC_00102]MCX5396768.1 hypothetical protein [Streptomyces sp. NBC_00102]